MSDRDRIGIGSGSELTDLKQKNKLESDPRKLYLHRCYVGGNEREKRGKIERVLRETERRLQVKETGW